MHILYINVNSMYAYTTQYLQKSHNIVPLVTRRATRWHLQTRKATSVCLLF